MNKKDIFAVLIIALLVVFFFKDVLFTNLTFVYEDFSRYFYPLYQYGVLCLKEGIVPFWNPHIYSGMPFLALLQLAIFYPLSIIFYLFPFMFSVKLFIISHYFLAGLFIYLLMRNWGLNISSALISSITYTFSGYMLSCVDLTNTLISATWIPLIFFFYSKAQKEQSFVFTVFTGITLGIQLLGGDPVVFYITVLVLFLFTFCYFSFKSFYGYLLAVIIAIGLTLFQTLPFFELTFLSVRAKGLGIWEATFWSLSKYELLNLICPFFTDANNLFQQRFFKSLSLCILPFFLSLITIFFLPLKNRKLIIFWIVILLSFIALSLGRNLEVYKFFHEHFPLFNMIRYPIKFFCIINFSISILAGFGFKYLVDNLDQKRRFIFLIPTFSLILACIFCWIFSSNQGFFLFKIVNKPLYSHIYSPLIGILLISAISLLICLGKRIRLWIFSFAVIGLVILNLIIFGIDINPVIDQKFYTDIPKTAKFIKEEGGFSRFLLDSITEKRYWSMKGKSFTEVFRNHQSALAPNMSLYYLLFDAYGYEAIPIRDYDRFIYYVKNVSLSKTLKLISMINVKYIISEESILEKGINLICLIKYGDRIVRIYENPNVLPRAYLVSNVIVVKDRKKVFSSLISPFFEPQQEVILEEEIQNPKLKIQNPKSKINPKTQIIDYQPNKIIINAYSPTNCILVLSDTYYPGWKAYVDGKETKIYRANYIFRAIEVPAGNHKVEFIYFPVSFKVGLLGTFLTLVLLVISQVIYRREVGESEKVNRCESER